MMNSKLLCRGLLVLMSCFFLSSCDDDSNNVANDNNDVIDENFDTNTQNIDISNSVSIAYEVDGTVIITNPFADKGVTISQSGANIIVESSASGTEVNYVLSGSNRDGSFKIYSDSDFGLVLNGVSLVSESQPAINIQSAKKANITLTPLTNNRLIDGTDYTLHETEDMKATLFSNGQLTFGGDGNLLVWGRYKHAISSNQNILISAGNITIEKSVGDGINAKSHFEMNKGRLTIISTGDAIDAGGYATIHDGTIDIATSGDASKGIKTKSDINLLGGIITINTTGNAYYDAEEADTSSAAGIKAGGNGRIANDCTLAITSSGSGGKGINISGTLTFDGGTTTVTTTGDQYVYDSNNDTAAKAIKSDGDLTVNTGTIKIKTSKTEAEGLESKATLSIHGGLVEIEAHDDCINATTHIEITGGKIYCISETNDAIDSNGTITISGGTVVAVGSNMPEAGFDCDNNTLKITGGTIVGVGGSTSLPTANVSAQYSLAYANGSFQIIRIESETGEEILTFKTPATFTRDMTLLFSSEAMKGAANYVVYTGGNITNGSDFHGLYSNTIYTKGEQVNTFTTNSMVTTIGQLGGSGGGRP